MVVKIGECITVNFNFHINNDCLIAKYKTNIAEARALSSSLTIWAEPVMRSLKSDKTSVQCTGIVTDRKIDCVCALPDVQNKSFRSVS